MLTEKSSDENVIDFATREPWGASEEAREQKPRTGFIKLERSMMYSPAGRALSNGAFRLYVALKDNYRPQRDNNGRLYLSYRKASKLTGCSKNSVGGWFQELELYGLIVPTTQPNRNHAPHYRLTELDYKGEPATQDYLRWDGTSSPVPVSQNWDTQKTPVSQKAGHEKPSVSQKQGHECPKNRDICRSLDIEDHKKESRSYPKQASGETDQVFEKESLPKADRNEYPAEFQELWQVYPDITNNSKKQAYVEWRKLSADDRRAARAAVPLYAKHANPGFVMHLDKWLRDRHFDSFAEQAKAAEEKKAEKDRIWERVEIGKLRFIRGTINYFQGQFREIDVMEELATPDAQACAIPDAKGLDNSNHDKLMSFLHMRNDAATEIAAAKSPDDFELRDVYIAHEPGPAKYVKKKVRKGADHDHKG